jgi:hypothetical protein
MLPALVPADWHSQSAKLVEFQLKEQIEKLERQLATVMLDSEPTTREFQQWAPPNLSSSLGGQAENSDTACSFYFYANTKPSAINTRLMEELEKEMSHPTGISTAPRPPTELDAVLVSPECAIVIDSKDVRGLK